MQFESRNFSVAGHKIAWGKTLTEVEAILRYEQPLSPYGGWPNLRVKCKDAYGFPATEFEARAPAHSKPVMQVIFELAPPSERCRSIKPNYWAKELQESLGNPDEVSRSRVPWFATPSGSVTYCAFWNIDDVRLTLSVFGGLRENEAGISAAGLFIGWANVIEAAKPFLARNMILEKELEINSHEATDLSIFKLDRKQEPFYSADYHLSNPDIALKNELLRLSQRALYKSRLLETPPIIKDMLNKNEVALWKMDRETKMVVSTHWDSVIIEAPAIHKIEWVNVLPAKGRGGMSLDADDLTLRDVHSSEKLTSVVRHIQKFIGHPIQCKKDFDA